MHYNKNVRQNKRSKDMETFEEFLNKDIVIKQKLAEELLEDMTDLTASIENSLEIKELDEELYADLLKQSMAIYDKIFNIAGEEFLGNKE